MTFFKLSALALATSLVLTGCGSDSNSGSNSDNNQKTPPVTDPTLSEIDQAKELVLTAKQFVSDGNTIKTAYEDTASLLTNEQDIRLDYVYSLPSDIQKYMMKNNITSLTASDIIALADNEGFKDELNNYTLVPSSDFIAKIDSNEKFTLSGSTQINITEMEWRNNPTTNVWGSYVDYTDSLTAVYEGYEDSLISLQNSTDHQGNLAFTSMTIGTGDEQVVLSAPSDGYKVEGHFSAPVVVNDDFDLDDVRESGILLEQETMTLGSLRLTANGNVIEAKNVKFSSMDITTKLADGSTLIRQLPYEIALTGRLQTESTRVDFPVTNAEITINMVADSDDIKNYISLDSEEDLVEAADQYVDMNVLLAIKGDVTKEGATTIPLDFQANLIRSDRNTIQLEGLTANVDGKALFVEGQTNVDDNYDVTTTTLTVKQNNAHLTLVMDAEGEFVQDATANNKLGDIMVGDTDYGDLYDNGGQITAKFIDDAIIVL